MMRLWREFMCSPSSCTLTMTSGLFCGGCFLVFMSRAKWDVATKFGWVANCVRKIFEFSRYQFIQWLICSIFPRIGWLINIYLRLSFQITIHCWCSSAQFVSFCPLVSVWWTLSRLFGGFLDKVQIGAWPYQFVVIPLENKSKWHKHFIFWNPSMHVLAKMTRTLYKASNGNQKLAYASNF